MKQLFDGSSREYICMLVCVDSLDFYECPKYNVLKELLRDTLEVDKLQQYSYDWEKETKLTFLKSNNG